MCSECPNDQAFIYDLEKYIYNMVWYLPGVVHIIRLNFAGTIIIKNIINIY